MALDAGTTSNRCILFDQKGQIVSLAQKEFTQRFPKPGWVEHDANEIWSTMLGVAVEAMQKAGASYEDIAAIGITNQRETTIVWDKKTGEPVYNAIVWQCRRTSEYCDSLMERGLVDRLREKTGLVTPNKTTAPEDYQYPEPPHISLLNLQVNWQSHSNYLSIVFSFLFRPCSCGMSYTSFPLIKTALIKSILTGCSFTQTVCNCIPG